MKWPCASNGLLSIAVLLLPLTAVPESRSETGAPNSALSATAHVNFKIIIPQVLYLQVGSGGDRARDAQSVSVMSNGHNVSLNATVGAGDSGTHARSILSSAARKGIAQDAQCKPGGRAFRAVICTVSMP